MRAFTANCECFRSTFSAAIISLLVSSGFVRAQQIPFGFMIQPTQIELTAPHVEAISGATAARLEQARQLAAARSWDESLDIWRDLSADKTDRVVALDGNRFLSLRNY